MSLLFRCRVEVFLGFWFFFFNQKTAYEMRISDWSSDVCSSDLAFQAGFERRRGDEGYVHDRDVIQILDQLPSLDPFLMKDRLMVEGVTPNPGYFEIGQDEWSRIREHVMARFRPIVEFAFAGPDAVRTHSRLRQCVEKPWVDKAIAAQAPGTTSAD